MTIASERAKIYTSRAVREIQQRCVYIYDVGIFDRAGSVNGAFDEIMVYKFLRAAFFLLLLGSACARTHSAEIKVRGLRVLCDFIYIKFISGDRNLYKDAYMVCVCVCKRRAEKHGVVSCKNLMLYGV